ncbi:MAG: hypothetical protein KKH32_10235 [Bacteroidetes bacterium]|nr:hypothetical protein [Bacteroidota bacterium]
MANPSIIGHLQSRLKRTLDDKSILIGELERGTGNYTIVSCLRFRHLIDDETKRNIGILPIRVADAADYWLSLSVNFDVIIKKINHVSITFFDDARSKIFRADWSNNESSIVHAQPHWHVHNRTPDFSSPLWDPEAVKIFSSEAAESVKDKIKNIHFTMAASWNSKLNHVESLADSEDSKVLKWIDGVLVYSKQQLTYLHDKTKV